MGPRTVRNRSTGRALLRRGWSATQPRSDGDTWFLFGEARPRVAWTAIFYPRSFTDLFLPKGKGKRSGVNDGKGQSRKARALVGRSRQFRTARPGGRFCDWSATQPRSDGCGCSYSLTENMFHVPGYEPVTLSSAVDVGLTPRVWSRDFVQLREASGGLYSGSWKNPFARRNGHLFSRRKPARIGGAVAGDPANSLFATVRTRARGCRP